MDDMILKRLANDIRKIDGIKGVVIATPDGVTVASAVDGDPEEIGAITVLMKVTTDEIVSSLELGNVIEAFIEGPDYKMMSFGWKEYIVGLVMDKKVSPVLLKKEIAPVLEETSILEQIK